MPGMLQPKRVLQWTDDGCNMQVTSLFTGRTNVMFLPIATAQWTAYQGGMYIQDAMPNLTADQREFILSGATPEEWAEVCAEDED